MAVVSRRRSCLAAEPGADERIEGANCELKTRRADISITEIAGEPPAINSPIGGKLGRVDGFDPELCCSDA